MKKPEKGGKLRDMERTLGSGGNVEGHLGTFLLGTAERPTLIKVPPPHMFPSSKKFTINTSNGRKTVKQNYKIVMNLATGERIYADSYLLAELENNLLKDGE